MSRYGQPGFPIPVKTTNLETGEVILWENMTKCATMLHISKKAIREAFVKKTSHKGYRFELIVDGEYKVLPKVRIASESPKDYIGRKSGKSSTRRLAQELGITTDEVMRLFDEWLKDRREREDWGQYQHMS